ncbi:hypothetical protein B0H16DRAFT_1895060 [Mycena metata]|uniref:Uncharacterized protein n=1 Tax=Mycena metata TaxID=1033252 RepID=A0AAD7MP09_9AGAR|nr:hypothetical protein B0H16DRAFT_1895060 [Mycena metata]
MPPLPSRLPSAREGTGVAVSTSRLSKLLVTFSPAVLAWLSSRKCAPSTRLNPYGVLQCWWRNWVERSLCLLRYPPRTKFCLSDIFLKMGI